MLDKRDPADQADQALITPAASVDEALQIAREQERRGRWSEALRVLDSTERRFPDDSRLLDARESMAVRRDKARRLLEDRILIGDAENERRKVQLLDKLSRAEPDNLLLTSRRVYWREALARREQALLDCGEWHVGSEPELARRCYEVASSLVSTPQAEQRLATINERLKVNQSQAKKRRRAIRQRERKLRAKVLLGNAKVAIDMHDYRGALDILDKVAKLQPGNDEVETLQQKALTAISPQVEALIKLGDHLYLDEQLEAAIATWQAALLLKPVDEEILARIERAKTVLNRLDTLRKQQKPGAAESL